MRGRISFRPVTQGLVWHGSFMTQRVLTQYPPPKGQFCTEDVDECLLQPNACQNGGTCTNRNGGYGCVCVNGWSGDDCSENIDDCAFASCTPGSTCIDRVASFSCLCPEGKAGKASGTTELEKGWVEEAWRPCGTCVSCVLPSEGAVP